MLKKTKYYKGLGTFEKADWKHMAINFKKYIRVLSIQDIDQTQ